MHFPKWDRLLTSCNAQCEFKFCKTIGTKLVHKIGTSVGSLEGNIK